MIDIKMASEEIEFNNLVDTILTDMRVAIGTIMLKHVDDPMAVVLAAGLAVAELTNVLSGVSDSGEQDAALTLEALCNDMKSYGAMDYHYRLEDSQNAARALMEADAHA